MLQIRIRDPVPFWPLDPNPGSGIRNRFIPGPGSQIPNPNFLELNDKFLGKKFYNSLKTGLQHFKNKTIFNFVKFVAIKKYMTTNFFHPLLCCGFWIRDWDPGSGMGKKSGSGIRDKHPGSATLSKIKEFSFCEIYIHKKDRIQNFSPLFSWFWIRDPGWNKIRIPDPQHWTS